MRGLSVAGYCAGLSQGGGLRSCPPGFAVQNPPPLLRFALRPGSDRGRQLVHLRWMERSCFRSAAFRGLLRRSQAVSATPLYLVEDVHHMYQYVVRFLFAAVVAAFPAYTFFVEEGLVWVAIVWLMLAAFIFGILIVVTKAIRMQEASSKSREPSTVAALILEFLPSMAGVVGYVAIFSMQVDFAKAVYFGVLLLVLIMILDIVSLKVYACESLLTENLELLHRRVQAVAKGEDFDLEFEAKRSVERLNSVYADTLGRGWFPVGYFFVKYFCMIFGAWIIYMIIS